MKLATIVVLFLAGTCNAFIQSAFQIALQKHQSIISPLHRRDVVRQIRCSSSNEISVGAADDVQNVGRGTLMSKQDAVKEVSGKVKGLYDTYPYPPEEVIDGPTVGYNHRWSWTHVHAFCTGEAPARNDIEILDAGCGTGVTAQYISHLNPSAVHFDALDLSSGALTVARERAERAGLVGKPNSPRFHHMSLYDVAQLGRHYDFINCVGVLHHLPDPVKGLRALCERLKPGGLMHIFVYSAMGRREIMLMQEALALLQRADGGTDSEDFAAGVALGRSVFTALPKTSRVKRREEERWSLENQRDSTFADMYLHPQEVDYTVPTLFRWIDTVADLGVSFVRFSNPSSWDLSRLLGNNPELLEQARRLPLRQQYRLAELLDPDHFTHYEFFLARAADSGKQSSSPWPRRRDWAAASEAELMAARPVRRAGISPWPADRVFGLDFQDLVALSPAERELLERVRADPTTNDDELDVEDDDDWGSVGLSPKTASSSTTVSVTTHASTTTIDEWPTLQEIVDDMTVLPKRAEILRLLDLQLLFLRH